MRFYYLNLLCVNESVVEFVHGRVVFAVPVVLAVPADGAEMHWGEERMCLEHRSNESSQQSRYYPGCAVGILLLDLVAGFFPHADRPHLSFCSLTGRTQNPGMKSENSRMGYC